MKRVIFVVAVLIVCLVFLFMKKNSPVSALNYGSRDVVSQDEVEPALASVESTDKQDIGVVPVVASPSDKRKDVSKKVDIVMQPFAWAGDEKLSDRMKVTMGIDGEYTFEERVAAIRKLGNHLETYEVNALMEFLKYDYRFSGYLAVKNDILYALIDQNKIPDNLQELMISMYRDHSYDLEWREYTLQHFSILYNRIVARGGADVSGNDADLRELRAVLWEATEETDSRIAGTALLAFGRLASEHEEFDKAKIAQAAAKIASDNGAHMNSRVAGLQVASELGDDAVLQVARDLLASHNPISLHMASVYSLGLLGTKQDLQILEAKSQSDQKYLRNASLLAVKRLKERLNAADNAAAGVVN